VIATIGARLDRLFRRITPDPFILAIILTVVVMALGWAHAGGSIVEVIDAWQGPRGFWSLLGFAMQMCLVLVTGHALAMSPPVRRLVDALAGVPKTGAAAAALVAAFSVGASLLNWGSCLVGGALLAKAVGRKFAARGVPVHYPLLAAAGYAGMMTWHGGFSGSAPLKVTTRDDLSELLGPELAGTVDVVPTTDTLLGGMNLIASLGAWVWVPVLVYFMHPKGEAVRCYEDVDPPASAVRLPEARTLQDSPLVTALLAVPLCAAVGLYLQRNGLRRLDPNAVNLILLTAGLILNGSPRRYVAAVTEAARGCAGIILQFPLYAGIMGVMAGTGLATWLAERAVSSASPHGYLVLTFLGAGLVNFFVPSGGGQWAVQGPVAIRAADALELPLASAVMAVAYGDQWTNMLQPFWALPLLGITGVRAGAILGYTFMLLVAGGIWFAACLVLFG
jgi:short-chain fatty acids transporter